MGSIFKRWRILREEDFDVPCNARQQLLQEWVFVSIFLFQRAEEIGPGDDFRVIRTSLLLAEALHTLCGRHIRNVQGVMLMSMILRLDL